jgi:drug/metabolite transporter (DMT)-like permease
MILKILLSLVVFGVTLVLWDDVMPSSSDPAHNAGGLLLLVASVGTALYIVWTQL